MTQKTYLAAAYNEQKHMQEVRDWLRTYGHDVTSSWIDGESIVTDKELIAVNPAQAEIEAYRDIVDLVLADILVLFTQVPSTTGGRHVELGIALALQKRIIIVGPIENVFQASCGIVRFGTFSEFQEYVRSVDGYIQTGPAEFPAEAKREAE